MRHFYLDFPGSRSSSLTERNEINRSSHFRWQSIKKYLYVAHAYSLNSFSFDLFSRVLVFHAHLFEYIIYAVAIGLSYMFMDFFIKQYTRKLDTRSFMNPLLRGVSFGILLQTALSSLVMYIYEPEPRWTGESVGQRREDIYLLTIDREKLKIQLSYRTADSGDLFILNHSQSENIFPSNIEMEITKLC